MLFEYLQQTQRIVGDQKEGNFNIADLAVYVNRARRRIAAAGQCVRSLPPSSGSIVSITPDGGGGTGYTTIPTVTISAPDAYGVGFTQAVATATIGGGHVTGIFVNVAGSGYVGPPAISITGGGGTGATATATLSPFLATVPNQEVYTFPTASAFITEPGVGEIIAVQTVAVSWGSQKPTLNWIDWSGFQAYCRSINLAATNWPQVWAQYAQGVNGSMYLFPIPDQVSQMDWDCYCLPKNLTSDSDIEALPYPWTEGVPYYAAHLAYMSAHDRDNAMWMEQKYKDAVREARGWVTPSMVPSFYQGL